MIRQSIAIEMNSVRAEKGMGRRLIKSQHGWSRHLHQLASLTRNVEQAFAREREGERIYCWIFRVLWISLKARAAVTDGDRRGDSRHGNCLHWWLTSRSRCAPLLHALCAARTTDRPADGCKKRCVSVVVRRRSPFVLRWLEARQQRVPNGPTAFLHAYSARAFLRGRDRSAKRV